MLEMAVGRPDEHQLEFFRGCQDFGISLGPAGSDDGCNPSPGQQLDSIGKWKEGIRGRHRSERTVAGLVQCPAGRSDPALVPGADPDGSSVDDQDNRIRLGVDAYRPGETEILHHVADRPTGGQNLPPIQVDGIPPLKHEAILNSPQIEIPAMRGWPFEDA